MSEQNSGPQLARTARRRSLAAFLGTVLFGAAAVIATGLLFAPRGSAYLGLNSWVFVGLLGFVLVLAGACVLVATTLTGPARARPARTVPGQPTPPPAPPWNPNDPMAGVAEYAAAGTAEGSAEGPAEGSAATPPAAPPVREAPVPETQPARTAPPTQAPGPAGRGLVILGSLLGLVGLTLAALAVVLAVLLPAPTTSIMVQFTDLYGRVQLEYCPSLPGSFAATASRDDLAGSDTILPVKVTGDVCGNPDYTGGVWLYLNRSSITVSDLP